MPIVPAVLGQLIQQKVDANVRASANVQGYDGPLSQQNPTYFIQMCQAIATGMAQGTPVITFTSTDSGLMGAPPIPGVGSGLGIVVDVQQTSQLMYTQVREAGLELFGKTENDPWPPAPDNSGRFLKALTDGIAQAMQEHFATCWILASVDPTIYAGSGFVNPGQFSGVVPSQVASAILQATPQLATPGWTQFVTALSTAYAESIMQLDTASLTIIGACVPSLTQVCGIPSVGVGTGSAT
jgi:hypothetical protein